MVGRQPKVLGEKREHMGVVDPLADGHPVEQNPFVMCSDLFRHAPAGFVPCRDDDLGADGFRSFEGEFGGKFCGAPGDAMTMLGCSHPVAEVAKVIYRVKVT